MDESETDKSEAATPFKLRRARERGMVARSLDLGFLAALAAALGILWIGGAKLAEAIAKGSREAFTTVASPHMNGAAFGELAWLVFAPTSWLLIAFAAGLFAIALVFDFLQVGPVFSALPLKPDFSRINPAKGLKRLLSWRMLVEALKASIKLAVYSTISWLVISDALGSRIGSMIDGVNLAAVLFATTFRLLSFFALAALGFAILDQIFVRRDYGKRMRMSRREVRREHRDREGDPRFKQKRRQFHSEFAKAVQALRAVRTSDVIITNPTHYAVALRYDRTSMAAPMVTARGAGEMARRIKRIAFTYQVLTVSDPVLARALYRAARIEEDIPPVFYQPVADLYLRYDLGRSPANRPAIPIHLATT